MAQNPRKPYINYNYFFHPNLCHVCKLEDQGMLNPCPQCLMIYYCSEEHRLLHREDHKQMCETLQHLSYQRNIRNSRNMQLERWIEYKRENLYFVQEAIERRLQGYEAEMILYAKSCLICFQQDNLTQYCRICKSINMCSDHEHICLEHSCQELKLCLDIQKYLANRLFVDEAFSRNILHSATETQSMKSFIELHFDNNRTDPYGPYIYSEYLTQPLTLYLGVQYTDLLNSLQSNCSFVIYIVGKFHNLLGWEIILHVFHRVTSLIIIIIEPNAPELVGNIPLCENCERENKILTYRCIDELYLELTSYWTYMKPNVIVGYHLKFEESSTLCDLRTVKRARCPIILTYHSLDTMRYNMCRLPLEPTYYGTNNFASCAPHRSNKDGTVCYHNKYFIVYKNQNLYPEKDSSDDDMYY